MPPITRAENGCYQVDGRSNENFLTTDELSETSSNSIKNVHNTGMKLTLHAHTYNPHEIAVDKADEL